MQIRDAITSATQELKAAGVENPALDARLLLQFALGGDAEMLRSSPERVMDAATQQLFENLVKRRVAREPVAYILQKKEFWSLDIAVTRDTLIPRPESETLVETALAYVKHRAAPYRILDFGTGSGCLLLALLSELLRSTGVGVDTNPAALHIAKDNAARLGLASRTEFVQSHWGRAVEGTFDLIVSNPPYIAASELAGLMPDVREFEPHTALVGGEDGLEAYREIAADGKRLLAQDGLMILEIGATQAKDVSGLLQQSGWRLREIRHDLAGHERCIVAQHIL